MKAGAKILVSARSGRTKFAAGPLSVVIRSGRTYNYSRQVSMMPPAAAAAGVYSGRDSLMQSFEVAMEPI